LPAGEHAGEARVCVPMTNSDNMQYVIPIEIGDPGQVMTAIPDTGSFELVVPSTSCESGCRGHPLFNSSMSNTFKLRGATQVIHYGQGDVTTEVDYDTVRLGGMEVRHQSLLQMTNNALENYDLATYDAVMGLGLSEQARPNDQDLSLLASMSEQVFGICLGQHDMDMGRLDLGGGVPELQNQYEELHCSKNTGHWGLKLSKLQVGEEAIGSGTMDMIVDSGTSLIAMPTDVYDKVLASMDAVEEDCSNVDQLPDLHLSVGDKLFTIPPQLYVGKVQLDDEDGKAGTLHLPDPFKFRGRKAVTMMQDVKGRDFLGGKSDGVCLPLFMELNVYTDDGPLFILGMPFLRAYSARFDLSRKMIGLAKLPLGSNVCSSCGGPQQRVNVNGGNGGNGDMASYTTPEAGRPADHRHHALQPHTISTARRTGPVGINMKRLRLPWWAVHESQARNMSHPHPAGHQISTPWRHLKM